VISGAVNNDPALWRIIKSFKMFGSENAKVVLPRPGPSHGVYHRANVSHIGL
jgi:hypothetical protein